MAITHISDTARWVAFYRAMETERPDAIFHDPFARRLAGPEGEEIVRTLKRGRQTAWAMIVRTKIFDEIIQDRVTQGIDLVLNLAAGLDARPWRLDLPQGLTWVDADLPGILDYKRSALRDEKPRCHYEAVAVDLTDAAARQSVFARFGGSHRRVLVITEGLLIYLEPAQVTELARALHSQPSFRWWLTDLASPRLLRIIARSWGNALERGNAPFKFGPAEGTAFFEPLGWHEVAFRSSLEEAHRLDREMPMMWLWRFLGRLSSAREQAEVRRMSGYVLFERSDAIAPAH